MRLTFPIGGLTVLVDLLKSTKPDLQNLALNCLNEMCLIDKVVESVLASGDNIIKLTTGLASSTNVGVSSGALQLLAVLCVNDNCRATVFENKGITSAVTLLSKYVLP